MGFSSRIQTDLDSSTATLMTRFSASPEPTFLQMERRSPRAYTNLDLVATKDRLGHWSYFGYDGLRRLVAATNAIGTVTTYDYCASGSLDSVSQAVGTPVELTTSFVYDNHGRRTRTIFPDSSSVTNQFDLHGRLTIKSDYWGSTTNAYDNYGRVLTVSNYFGQLSKLQYDILDRITNTVNRDGVITTNSFDDLDRLIRSHPQGAAATTYAYTARGLTNVVNPLSFVTKYAKDVYGRTLYETNANNEVTAFTYDPVGAIRTLTDAKGSVTSWGYDIEGRNTSKTNASNVEIFRYSYDADGRLTNRWTPAKLNTTYTHDDLGNITAINYNATTDITLGYDALGRLTNMVDAAGTTKLGYVNQHLAFEDGPWNDDRVAYTTTANKRTRLTVAQPSGIDWSLGYAYDAGGKIDSITSADGVYDYQYGSGVGATTTASVLIKKLLLPNTAYITFDSVGRVTSTRLRNSSHADLNSHAYVYDDASQRATHPRIDSSVVTYGYDNIGQLTSAYAAHGATNRWHERLTYVYDKAGNLSNRVANGFTNTWTVDALDQLLTYSRPTATLTVAGSITMPATSVTVNSGGAQLFADNTFVRTNMTLSNGANTFTAVATDALGRGDTNVVSVNLPTSASYSYDSNGNLLSDGRKAFAYDDENQLTSVLVTNEWKSEFVYDGKLRRRITKEFTWNGGAWVQTDEIRYVFDGMLAIQERNQQNIPIVTLTRGLDASGTLNGAGGVGGLLARTENIPATPKSTAYFHVDGSGNVTCLVNDVQIVAARYIYDPFGNTLSATGPLADDNRYRFSSKEIHSQSNLYYYGYRHYDALLQRWTSSDPLGDEAFRRHQRASHRLGHLRSFLFVRNSPISLIDPWGLEEAPPFPKSVDECLNNCKKDKDKDAIGCAARAAKGNAKGLGFGIIITGAAGASWALGPVPGIIVTIGAGAYDAWAIYDFMKDLDAEREKVKYDYLKCIRGCLLLFPGNEDAGGDFWKSNPAF